MFQIVHASLSTSIGDNTAVTLAGLTAGLKRFKRQNLADVVLTTAPADDLTQGSSGSARLLSMLRAAANELLDDFEAAGTTRDPRHCPQHGWLALPAQLGEEEQVALCKAMALYWSQRSSAPMQLHPLAFGATAAFAALLQAAEMHADMAMLILAVDSLCEAPVLASDHVLGRVYRPGNADGWVAGEAAASVVLRPLTSISAAPAGTFAIHLPGLAADSNSTMRWPSDALGDGKSAQTAMAQALRNSGMQLQNISHLVCDQDGSSWRSHDLRAALGRIQAQEGQAWEGKLVEPALHLGQLGAAWGTVFWSLVVWLHAHELEQIHSALCLTQDVSGQCAACVIEQSPN